MVREYYKTDVGRISSNITNENTQDENVKIGRLKNVGEPKAKKWSVRKS